MQHTLERHLENPSLCRYDNKLHTDSSCTGRADSSLESESDDMMTTASHKHGAARHTCIQFSTLYFNIHSFIDSTLATTPLTLLSASIIKTWGVDSEISVNHFVAFWVSVFRSPITTTSASQYAVVSLDVLFYASYLALIDS